MGAGRNGEYDERVKDILKVLVLPGNRGWRGEAHTPDQWWPADRWGETDEEDTGTHEKEEQEVSFWTGQYQVGRSV